MLNMYKKHYKIYFNIFPVVYENLDTKKKAREISY